MSRTVFFSWQRDRPTREGRNFVERALEIAVSRIAQDVEVEEVVREGLRVDKDTKAVPGSPPIFQTILAKINRASIFVADLTFCATRPDGRSSPNPNVLIEYGWALKSLGYFQVLTVMNAAYGAPSAESLPFDLAQLRFPITYSLPDNAPIPTRDAERERLAKNLETALRGVFESEEFKAKLPKLPELPPFPRKDPKNGKARFRQMGEPLGFVRDSMAQMIGSPNANPIYLAEGSAMWLRLMPLNNPGRIWLTQNLRQPALGLATLSLMQTSGGIGFLQGEDGCGYYSLFGDDKTYSTSYVFNTGEVWIINSWLGQVPGYVELQEASFIRTLDGCVLFLDRLGCTKPYQWAVGMEGIKGRNLLILDRPNRPLGICLADVIDDEGIYKNDGNTTELLRPFFEKVFDQCGTRRQPSS